MIDDFSPRQKCVAARLSETTVRPLAPEVFKPVTDECGRAGDEDTEFGL